MSGEISFALKLQAAQAESLSRLQSLFATACNDLSPLMRESRCWNRVALHHLAYRGLRERFPQLGSQMACNVIYSVCRAARLIYQHPQSPWNPAQAKEPAKLPLLRFGMEAPVFFDRHTLSIKNGQLSMFTLDGRIRFRLDLRPDQLARFGVERLREIVLHGKQGQFVLQFAFADEGAQSGSAKSAAWEDLPEYLVVLDSPVGDAANRPQTVMQPAQARAA